MISRRYFLKVNAAAALALGWPVGDAASKAFARNDKVSVFSKNLQWVEKEKLGDVAVALGFDGVDLTVRPGGHVEPGDVTRDLGKTVRAVRAAGGDVFSIVTAINDADQEAETIVRAASALGIKYYRLNWFPYDAAITIEQNLDTFRKRMERIARLNERYNIHGAYQNHSGSVFGSSVWDLHAVLRDLDPRYIGCQFDVRHACVEGFNSWVNDLGRIAPYIQCYNIKDFHWVQKDGKWQEESVPLGSGVIDFVKFFQLMSKYQVRGPLSMHFEYALGGAESGNKTLSVSDHTVLDAMRRDLGKLRSLLNP